eukprot:11693995-Ditylum_brightwellii.AAC.1
MTDMIQYALARNEDGCPNTGPACNAKGSPVLVVIFQSKKIEVLPDEPSVATKKDSCCDFSIMI